MTSAYKLVPSGQVMNSFAPQIPVMQVYWNHPEYPEKTTGKVGDTFADYFQTDFYGSFNKIQTDFLINFWLEVKDEYHEASMAMMNRLYDYQNKERENLKKFVLRLENDSKENTVKDFAEQLFKTINEINRKKK
jgi:hypothetical protein